MVDDVTAERIASQIEDSHLHGAPLRREAMILLSALDDYDWSGIYRLEGGELRLDEYVGAPTDHDRIPIGRGVCGTAVASNSNQIVADVSALDNYLACSTKTKSEIVVLVRDPLGGILGQIDIDGHRAGAFDHTDEHMLERIGAALSRRWE